MDLRETLHHAIQEGAFTVASPERPIVTKGRQEYGGKPHWLFDFRAIMLQPENLDAFAELFWKKYADQYPFQVAGPESAGISLVAAIVMKSVEKGRPVNGFYLRKSRKRDGLMKVIEGTPNEHPVIYVDDLINSGKTFNRQRMVMRDAGLTVSDAYHLLAFRDRAAYAFAAREGCTVASLFTLEDFGLSLREKNVDVPQEHFRVVWKFSSGRPSHEYVVEKSAPAQDESRIFFGSDRGIFYALNKKDGSVAWQFQTGEHPKGKGIFSSPVVHKGVVYFGAYDGSVYAFACDSGKMIWRNDEADWIGSSPALAPDLSLLYIGLEFGLAGKRGGIAALDMKTGETKWRQRAPEFTHCSPLYIAQENAVVIGGNDFVIRLFDAKTGVQKWEYKTGGEVKACFAYDPKHRLIFGGSHDATLYALRAQDGGLAWKLLTGATIYSTPWVDGDVVYSTSLDKRLYAFDSVSGVIRWTYPTGGRVFASPVVLGGSVWTGSNDGRLYEIDRQRGTVIRFHQFTERVVNAPVLDSKTKRLFVPTCANELYCLERVTS